MSTTSTVAKRYANALFLLAKDNNNVAKVEQDLKLVAQAVSSEPQFTSLLGHPGVETTVKHKLLEDVFAKKIDQTVLFSLQLLCDRRRTDLIVDLASYFTQIAGRELGQAEAHVFSAQSLSDSDLKDIGNTFTKLLGKEVRLETHIKTDLIGGIQVRVGDTLYDGSIAGKLARLEKTLHQTQVL